MIPTLDHPCTAYFQISSVGINLVEFKPLVSSSEPDMLRLELRQKIINNNLNELIFKCGDIILSRVHLEKVNEGRI